MPSGMPRASSTDRTFGPIHAYLISIKWGFPTKERTTLMQDPVQIEKLLRARERILAFIDLDQRALERTPGIQALELSLTSWRRQLVSIDSKFTALTGHTPQQYQAES